MSLGRSWHYIFSIPQSASRLVSRSLAHHFLSNKLVLFLGPKTSQPSTIVLLHNGVYGAVARYWNGFRGNDCLHNVCVDNRGGCTCHVVADKVIKTTKHDTRFFLFLRLLLLLLVNVFLFCFFTIWLAFKIVFYFFSYISSSASLFETGAKIKKSLLFDRWQLL